MEQRELGAISSSFSGGTPLKLSSIADESMKRYDNLKNKLKKFQQGKIDIDRELIHAVINKIIVLDEHTIAYCISKNRIQTC